MPNTKKRWQQISQENGHLCACQHGIHENPTEFIEYYSQREITIRSTIYFEFHVENKNSSTEKKYDRSQTETSRIYSVSSSSLFIDRPTKATKIHHSKIFLDF